jgi:hypothetical protein
MSDYPLREFAEFENYAAVKCGLALRCPNCGRGGSIFFSNPIGGEVSEKFRVAFAKWPTWVRTGDDLESMSLSPSVKMKGHFHSHVSDGMLSVDSPFECTKS